MNNKEDEMKIIIASHMGLNSDVSEYPDRCPYYTLVELNENKIEKVTNIENDTEKISSVIKEQKADVFIAAKISRELRESIEKLGVDVVANASGRIADVINNFVKRKEN